ncbi:MAG: hypothetical protein K2H14_09470 [Muribaculaceae bacterium]|nr:hypothetical protein [Muribaculaceae bacterium]
MKHSTLATIVFMAAGISAAAAVQPIEAQSTLTALRGEQTGTVAGNRFRKAPEARLNRTAANATLWRAATEQLYMWTGDEWDEIERYKNVYNEAGKLTSQLLYNIENGEPAGETNRTTYEYNAAGNPVMILEEISSNGVDFTVSQRIEQTYDPILENVPVTKRQWYNINGQLHLVGNCYNRTITRNDDGNITAVEIATIYEGGFDPSIRIEITYGADGKATAIKETDLSFDGKDFSWVDAVSYTDIEWENTDGQIYSADNLFIGSNRIKSATCVTPHKNLKITVDYLNDEGDYESISTGVIDGLPITVKAEYDMLNSYGGERLTQTFTYEEDGQTYVERYTECIDYDKWGYITLYEYVDVANPDMPLVDSRQTGVLEYDPTHGYPLSYTVSFFNPDTEEDDLSHKVIFSDYTDVASIRTPQADSQASTPVYYNLQGIKVENPAPGIYIRRQGQETSKVIIR